MSDLDKTTIIPDGNPNDVLDYPILKMVVLGDNLKLAQIANRFAHENPIVDRKVLWFKEPSTANLKQFFPKLEDNLDDIQGFSVSTTNVIAYYIRKGETVNNVRVDRAYNKAGLPENNR